MRISDNPKNEPDAEAAERSRSGLTTFFEGPREELRDKLTEALDILSDDYTQIRQQLESRPQQNPRRHGIDEKVKIADIAAIKELLTKGEMDDAQLRLNLALLTFPEDQELKSLEETLLRQFHRHQEFRQSMADAEANLQQRKWELAIRSLEKARSLDAGNPIPGQLMANALAQWAQDLIRSDRQRAAELVAASLKLDSENTTALELRARLTEDERARLVESAIHQAKELESKGQFDEAIRTLESFLSTQHADPRVADLCEGLKRARERHVAEGIINNALQQVTSLETEGTIPALQTSLQILDEALHQVAEHPALSNVRSRVGKQLTARQNELNALLDRIEHEISGSEYRTRREQLRNAFAIDPSNSRARELQAQLKRARLQYLWQSYRKTAAILLATVGLAGAMLFFGRNALRTPLLDGKLVVTSSPKNAKVFIDGASKGNTPYEATWQIRRGETLRMTVRLELENYEPFERVLVLSPNQTETLTPTLSITNKAAELQRLSALAQEALQRGDLMTPADNSAASYLNQIKELDPVQSEKGSLADDLLNQIKAAFKARLSQLNNRERNSETELVLLEQYATLAADDVDINSRLTVLTQQVQRLKNQVNSAIAAGVLLSLQAAKGSPSALPLLNDLERRFPREKASLKAKRDEIRGKVVEMALAKCGSPSAECSSFIEMALRDYPNDAELRSIPERAITKVEPPPSPLPPPQPPREALELKSKLEEAFAAKRYVSPANNSSVHYANELLKLVPDDSRATDLKQESRNRAETDVEQLMLASQEKRILGSEDEALKVRSDFQHAKEILAGLRSFWPAENAFQRSQALLDARSKDLEDFLSLKRTYSLLHDHAVGNCKGVFRISGYAVQYQPDQAKDEFLASLTEVTELKRKDGGESLEFKVGKRTFTFKVNKEIVKTGNMVMVENHLREAQLARERLSKK